LLASIAYRRITWAAVLGADAWNRLGADRLEPLWDLTA
jgi:hypothetical protein